MYGYFFLSLLFDIYTSSMFLSFGTLYLKHTSLGLKRKKYLKQITTPILQCQEHRIQRRTIFNCHCPELQFI